jgi:nitronate monooxygenase
MIWPDSRLLDLLGIDHPIIQAPMAGASTPALVEAVSNAGALGGFGATDCTPEELRTVIRDIRRRTHRPFIINLYLERNGAEEPEQGRVAVLRDALAPLYAELAAGAMPDPKPLFQDFEAQIAVVIEERVPVFSAHFGAPPPEIIRALKAAGTRILGTATTVDEARILEAGGVDALIAQGSEAGGHRGTFASPVEQAMIGTLALVPQVVDAVRVPVIAAGGIMDGRGLAAALALGAAGVQMGTAFVACPENDVHPAYRARLLQADARDAVLTAAVSGQPARLLRNRLVEVLEAHADAALPFARQYSLTTALRRTAAVRGDAEFLTMWAGQGVGLARSLPAAELVRRLVAEAEARMQQLNGRPTVGRQVEVTHHAAG